MIADIDADSICRRTRQLGTRIHPLRHGDSVCAIQGATSPALKGVESAGRRYHPPELVILGHLLLREIHRLEIGTSICQYSPTEFIP
jgi:hypothetical protein